MIYKTIINVSVRCKHREYFDHTSKHTETRDICNSFHQSISTEIGFDGSDYIFYRNEPYELYFEWYLREYDVKCGLTVYADPDDTEWFVVSDGGRKRIRRRVDREDVEGSAEMFLGEVLSVMGRE